MMRFMKNSIKNTSKPTTMESQQNGIINHMEY